MSARLSTMLAGTLAVVAAVIVLLAGAELLALVLALVAAGLFWASTRGAERT